MQILKLADAKPDLLAEKIKEGAVLVLPTDTVYGLVCDAKNQKAVEKIFGIKKRDRQKPLPVFVKNLEIAKKYAKISEEQEDVIKKSWPGAVTFVLKAKQTKILSNLVYKDGTIALRSPNYILVQQILEIFASPLAQTSANISGEPATTKIADVVEQFQNQDILIIDDGNLPANKPSTIIDLSKENINILRK